MLKRLKKKIEKRGKNEGFFEEFLSFINKGNIFDMAIGIIVGSAFTKIVNSLVNDVVMPLISNVIEVDITSAKVTLKEEVLDEAGEVVEAGIYLNYGMFIQNIINFLIIALAVFLTIKTIGKIKDVYVAHRVKTLKKFKQEFPEYFDEDDDRGTHLYEKMKKAYPSYFKDEIVEEETPKDPLTIQNELLTKLNENIELMTSKLNKE